MKLKIVLAAVMAALVAGATEKDSTAEIQGMLDRGGKVVITREGSPWCVRPLMVRSNTDLVFEEGAVLQAATNCYFNADWSVLQLFCVSNVTIRGKGTVRMNKMEYRTRAYKPGDGRHCISMRAAENVLVEDLTLLEAGADGIYIVGRGETKPASRNVTLRRVTCDGCWRQGVSVISAENFLAEDCRFINTKGSSPEAGLDFEPNYRWEKLVNCTMRRCLLRNNAGTGLHVSPHQMNVHSTPVSIRILDCEILDSGFCGLEFMRNGNGKPPKGDCLVENVRISGTTYHGIVFARKFADMFRVTLKNVTVERSGLQHPDYPDIAAQSRYWYDNPPGNIVFDNVTLKQPKDRPWFEYREPGLGTEKASGWQGEVKVVSPKGEKFVKLDRAWMDATFDPPPQTQPPARVRADFANAKVVDLHPGEMRAVSPFHAVHYQWVFYVDKPKACHFRTKQIPWGSRKLHPSRHPAHIRSITAKGRGEFSVPQPEVGSGIITFEAKEPGFYMLNPITESSKLLLEESDVPVAWYLGENSGRSFCAAEKASMWFEPVPGQDFGIITGGKDEGIRMELYDPAGKRVWMNPKVIDWDTYVGRTEGRGLWRLDYLAPKVKELWQGYSANIDLRGAPGCLFLDPDRYWTFEKPAKPLKVLMIGNSYSICVLHQMPRICKDLGLKLDLCSLYIGGCPLSKHAANLHTTNAPYVVSFNYQGETNPARLPICQAIRKRDDGQIGNLRTMIAADTWDVVTVQQASHESWKPECYEPCGSEVLAAVKELAPQAKVYVQQTWSYASVSYRLRSWKLDQQSMFDRLENAYAGFAKNHGLDMIRTGEAVQRFRKARGIGAKPDEFDPNDLVGKKITVTHTKNDWSVEGDCIHLNDRGEYLQGLVWTAKLFNADVTKSTYAPSFLKDKPDEVTLMRQIATDLR